MEDINKTLVIGKPRPFIYFESGKHTKEIYIILYLTETLQGSQKRMLEFTQNQLLDIINQSAAMA